MADFSVIDHFEIEKNETFITKAKELEPELYRTKVKPVRMVQLKRGKNQNAIIEKEYSMEHLSKVSLDKGDTVCFDFGKHTVGYVSFELESVGSHFDAPLYIRVKFGEMPIEILDQSEDYNGWIGCGWIQEEFIHVDVLPTRIVMPRRYAFRYMEIKVLGCSSKYKAKISHVDMESVSSVKWKKPEQLKDQELDAIEKVSINTLYECMQSVFEDGPKRDRRMWLGDFRLQARANYEVYKYNDLVKRCLYLFGGLTFNGGKMPACIFMEPTPEPDDTYLFDYALFYIVTLWDYYEKTKDMETVKDLYEIAIHQIDLSVDMLNDKGVVEDLGDTFWCFLDWGDGLNKQAGAQAVLLYAIRYAIKLANVMEDTERVAMLEQTSQDLKAAAVRELWDEEKQMFISGANRQVSWASQVWMVLARVFDREKSHELLMRTIEVDPELRMVTPYMYHHFIDALIRCDEKELAMKEMKKYWGEMIHDGADTFWELYNPNNKNESPYGSSIVNSYCHAWSCTPVYFIRKFF